MPRSFACLTGGRNAEYLDIAVDQGLGLSGWNGCSYCHKNQNGHYSRKGCMQDSFAIWKDKIEKEKFGGGELLMLHCVRTHSIGIGIGFNFLI
jgi:hypothetical protein